MDILFIIFFIVLLLWILNLALRKLGIYKWFFNSQLMSTRFMKSIVFFLKIYFIPLKGVSLKSGEKSSLGTMYFLISTSYLLAITVFIFSSFSFADSSHMIEQILKRGYGTIEGEVTDVSKYSSARRTQYYLTIKDSEEKELRIRYFFINDAEKMITGQNVHVLFVKGLLGDNELVSLSHKDNQIRTIREDLGWRLTKNHKYLKISVVSILLTLILPWIRFWQFGLIPFFYRIKVK